MVRLVALLMLGTALAGCTVGPDYHRPQAAGADAGWVEPGTPGNVDARWWENFGDATLDALVARAMEHAPQVEEARARLAEARANRDAVAGGRAPAVQANGQATQNRLSENGQLPLRSIPVIERDFPLYDMGFDASWEIDLWGRRTREAEAARARVEAAEYARRDVLVALTAEIVRNYFDLRGAQADVRTLTDIADADADLARLTQQRADAGEASRLDAERAHAAARAAAAAIPDARARGAAAAYRIAALLGVAPEEVVPGLLRDAPVPVVPDTVLVGVRSDLLERRPDVRRAERELAAATADVGVATADLFPRFSLFGSIGQQARDPGDLASGGSTRWAIGPGFSWPIFSGGAIRARVRGADARAQGAAARYVEAVTGALADSEGAINRFLNARAAAEDARAALVRQDAAFALSRQRVAAGEDDRLALARATAEHAGATQRRDQAVLAQGQAAAALFKALGGGWEGQEAPTQQAAQAQ